MTFWKILETLIIGPLKLVFEWIFLYAKNMVSHPGWAIVVLSIIMNILVLPLYKRADAIQEKVRDKEAKLKEGVDHIKKSFTGDERMMILQTYYRQNNYKPADSLKGSVSLFLQIPFFMAAYQFLSGLDLFTGVSFGPITDLSMPDGLFVIGNTAINALPFLMTIINLISCTVYLNKSTAKTRIQLFAVAIFFLIFLYNSPSCLVLYWTLNNAFSLVKNIIMKVNLPFKKETKHILLCLFGLMFEIIGICVYGKTNSGLSTFLIYIGLAFQIPLLYSKCKNKIHLSNTPSTPRQPNHLYFMIGMLFIAILTGILIPSAYIASSPQEFVDITYFHNPLWYIVSSFCLAAGTCLIWMNVFYYLLNTKVKLIMENATWIISIIMLSNYMFLSKSPGIISAQLQYVTTYTASTSEQVLNLQIIIILSVLLYALIAKAKKLTSFILLVLTITITVMSTMNIVTIKQSVDGLKSGLIRNTSTPRASLSTDGKNVVIIMLDRAIGAYVPYIFDEQPELKAKFDGFTYYSNTISFGGYTNFGVPALFGGYEYTPVEINKRDTETLVTKHNEAIMMMPAIFTENDYQVTICDIPYANYQWIPDLSIYDVYPEIETYLTSGKFMTDDQKEAVIKNNHRNFFCFSLMKTAPLCWHFYLYNNGNYNRIQSHAEESFNYEFADSYNVLADLSTMTKITNDDTNTFLILSNDLTHEPAIIPELSTSAQQSGSLENNDRMLELENEEQLSHYQTNMITLMLLGDWFDYLRENNAYDNTRIILVADHGRSLGQLDELIISSSEGNSHDAEMYYPLLMVKDFGSNGFVTSDEFMTNADVPTLCMENLIPNPINPFTQKPITNNEKYAHDQYIIMSGDFNVNSHPENTFSASKWACVRDNIWDKNNWSFIEDEIILKEHSTP